MTKNRNFDNFKKKQREIQKEEGYFDGRFANKVQRQENKYRKPKHKKKFKDLEEE